jgi:hypothetical protein
MTEKAPRFSFLINNIMKKAFLYWIHLQEHTDVTTQGYIGVSMDYKKRFAMHMKECESGIHPNTHLIHAYNKYGAASMLVNEIFSGDENECYLRENKLRNTTNIGWNVAPGGHKGPGRIKGSIAQQKVTANNLLKKKQREERIASGNLTSEDIIFLAKKEEQRILRDLRKAERSQIKLLEKKKKKEAKKKVKEKLDEEKRQKKERDSSGAITKQKPRPRCSNCKLSLAKPNGTSKHGFQLWHKYCVECSKSLYSEKHKHLINKKTICDQCSFEAIDVCQLDLIYSDGDKNNKNKENLITLCANCSRIHKKNLRTEKKSILNVTVDSSDLRI